MDVNIIISISAIFIALCALGVSIWEGYETRKNNRLSMTPKLEFFISWIVGDNLTGISIQNNGLGPAIINTCEIHFEDKVYSVTEFAELVGGIIAKDEQAPKNIRINGCDLSHNSTFIATEKVPFIWLNEDSSKYKENIRYLQKLISKINIKIEYKSIYNQKYSLSYINDLQ